MKAYAYCPKQGRHEVVDLPDPEIRQPDEIKVEVIRVGVCGTDQEISHGHIGEPPPGCDFLVIGHENLGRVVGAGPDVKEFKPGDLAVMTVRHSCGECPPCLHGLPDLCETGKYTERGVIRLHGNATKYVVDSERNACPVPSALESIAVLAEPMSVVEKGIAMAVEMQHRIPWPCAHPEHGWDQPGWGFDKNVFVAGAGPVGLLAAYVLALHGCKIWVQDILPEDHPRIQLAKSLGAKYICGKDVKPEQIPSIAGPIDMVIEATGNGQVAYGLLPVLGANGIFCFLGIPSPHVPIQIDGGALIREQVIENQVAFGSVSANKSHFIQALRDMQEGEQKYPGVLEKMITRHLPFNQFDEAFDRRDANDIKTVVEIQGQV
ncbi:MAG TPA: glucose 1-dehydrogenase [Armatimonadota bacterium]|nr:glucose 1-dehydrogenase [Armatimonadota bacterium]